MKKVILASTSQQRIEILSKTNLKFDIIACEYEEDMSVKLKPAELTEFLALGKAKSIASKYKDSVIISADTIVFFKDKILGKPNSISDARSTLNMLNGGVNKIITGVAIIDTSNNLTKTFHCTTDIYMKKVSSEIIESYLKTNEPLNKAGSYALQGMGAILVEKIDGDFFNAMGLPLSRLSDVLREFNINVLK